jgi:hypothetical protein
MFDIEKSGPGRDLWRDVGALRETKVSPEQAGRDDAKRALQSALKAMREAAKKTIHNAP